MDRTAESTDSPAVSWLRQPLMLAAVLAFVACFAGIGSVPAYLPPKFSPESVYGIISFDLGRRTLPLSTPDQLRAWIEQKPGARVVLRADEASHLPADLLGRAVILYDERGRKASPFVIADWNPALAARR